MQREKQRILSREWYARTEQRIAWLTLIFGIAAAGVVWLLVSPSWGVGLLLGALLAWLNLHWLQQTLDAVVRVGTAQSGVPRPRVSFWIYARFFLRYALVGLVLYTAWLFFRVPVVSMLTGLCALGAAVVAVCTYEIFVRPG